MAAGDQVLWDMAEEQLAIALNEFAGEQREQREREKGAQRALFVLIILIIIIILISLIILVLIKSDPEIRR